MRLDFESFNTLAGTNTLDSTGDCRDTFSIGGVSRINQTIHF